jgi:hypothetical protein
MPSHGFEPTPRVDFKRQSKDVLTENQKAHNVKQREIQRVRNREK